VTFGLAGVWAHTAAGRGKRVILVHHLPCFGEFTLFNELGVALDIDTGRARRPAWGSACLFDDKSVGVCLGILFIGSLAFAEALVEFAFHFNRAGIGTLAATFTFVDINISGSLLDFNFKIAWRTLHIQNIRIGVRFYIEMSAAFHQFRRENTH